LARGEAKNKIEGRYEMWKTSVIIALILVLSCIVVAHSDVVVMKDDTTHEGTVDLFDNNELILIIHSGKIILTRSEISSIHFDIDFETYDRQKRKAISYAEQVPATQEGIIEFGDIYQAQTFSIRLVEAKIEQPQVRDMFGDLGQGKTPNLVLKFCIQNTDDRKILRYREENLFLAGYFLLMDDVGNTIRGVNYGFGNTLVGALTGEEDILPGQEVSHIEVFSAPPPKTKYLILNMDLAALGEQGKAQFRISAEKIRNFYQE